MNDQRIGVLRNRLLDALQKLATRGVKGKATRINNRWVAWSQRQR